MPNRSVVPTIRQYRRGDAGQIWALTTLTLAESSGAEPAQAPLPLAPTDAAPSDCPDLADIGTTYLLSGGDFLVAEADGTVVGTAGLLLAADAAADVVRVAVHPALRRRGIGTALLEAVERRAVDLGIRRLTLDVGPHAKDAIAFYQASGFRNDEAEEEESRWDLTFFSKAL